ncbi:hypothetical protein NE237_012645 [Protea cynaroides]|uniref:Uncharacterized protein n=1 Tax=Protea cynaroides TaxID=273540 RepID=A0A9Q0JY76_9MAGN|nr:hypothetical protein NE237_012645 [Protea cynaroides]
MEELLELLVGEKREGKVFLNQRSPIFFEREETEIRGFVPFKSEEDGEIGRFFLCSGVGRKVLRALIQSATGGETEASEEKGSSSATPIEVEGAVPPLLLQRGGEGPPQQGK